MRSQNDPAGDNEVLGKATCKSCDDLRETVKKQAAEIEKQAEEIKKQAEEIKKQAEEIKKQAEEIKELKEAMKKQEDAMNKKEEDYSAMIISLKAEISEMKGKYIRDHVCRKCKEEALHRQSPTRLHVALRRQVSFHEGYAATRNAGEIQFCEVQSPPRRVLPFCQLISASNSL